MGAVRTGTLRTLLLLPSGASFALLATAALSRWLAFALILLLLEMQSEAAVWVLDWRCQAGAGLPSLFTVVSFSLLLRAANSVQLIAGLALSIGLSTKFKALFQILVKHRTWLPFNHS